MTASTNSKKKSRHFTVVVRRNLPMLVQHVFDSWVDPTIRHRVLVQGRNKNTVKEVNPIEGGFERYEDRWRNRLIGQTERRYLAIRRSHLIIAHAEHSMVGDTVDQFFAIQELILFKPCKIGTEIVASSQCVSIQPTYVHAVEDSWNSLIDAFETALELGKAAQDET